MTAMKIAIVGGGKLSTALVKDIKKADFVIGADSGAYWLITHKIIPDLSIGDFDSVGADEFLEIKKVCQKVKKYPREKNFTDLELAIKEAVKLNPQKVAIYGVVGSRLDHFLSSVYLLEHFLKLNINATINDSNNELLLLKSSISFGKNKAYRYFSVLAHTKKIMVSINGSKYPVHRKTIVQSQSLGVSNEINGKKARIIIHRGTALIVRSRD